MNIFNRILAEISLMGVHLTARSDGIYHGPQCLVCKLIMKKEDDDKKEQKTTSEMYIHPDPHHLDSSTKKMIRKWVVMNGSDNKSSYCNLKRIQSGFVSKYHFQVDMDLSSWSSTKLDDENLRRALNWCWRDSSSTTQFSMISMIRCSQAHILQLFDKLSEADMSTDSVILINTIGGVHVDNFLQYHCESTGGGLKKKKKEEVIVIKPTVVLIEIFTDSDQEDIDWQNYFYEFIISQTGHCSFGNLMEYIWEKSSNITLKTNKFIDLEENFIGFPIV